ncbi:uncharacterized protein NPIL_306441 [Nephila pilipes]|uniref:Methyltransferase domain-containing protein n=1 Tax=Nephila pilipes TaxID=299642 RepID=A0A8X6U4Q4_NEPPI|nr:uncharacterized protein NPIL_306441 [Nephila pilipes]
MPRNFFDREVGESMERVVHQFPCLHRTRPLHCINRKRNNFKKWLPLSACLACLVFGIKRLVYPSAIYENDTEVNEMKYNVEVDFERLLYYVQHPKTLCYTALSLGGSKDTNNRTDGDKIICQDQAAPLRPPCLVYSFGGNDEWSFEEEIVNFGCEVYTFDPSLKMGNHQHKPNIWFYSFGISHFNEDNSPEILTISSRRDENMENANIGCHYGVSQALRTELSTFSKMDIEETNECSRRHVEETYLQ